MYIVHLLYLSIFGRIVSGTNIQLSEGVKPITATTTTASAESKLLGKGEIINEAEEQLSPTMATRLPKLPSQQQSFTEIRESGAIYVEKTEFVEELVRYIRLQSFVFFTRPKGFGKTTLLQMLEQFFLGNKEVFKNTPLFNRGNTEEADGTWCHYPVIFLNFGFDFECETKGDFKFRRRNLLENIGKNYGLGNGSCETLSGCTSQLERQFQLPVIILIDDCDLPLQKCGTKEIQYDLTNFYTDIKYSHTFIRMALITGVSRFDFNYYLASGFNNYEDLTFHEKYASMMGFTLQEVEQYFRPYLEYHAVENYDGDYEAVLQELVRWYDGYRFSFYSSVTVLNPVSTIRALKGKESFKVQWFQTNKAAGVIKEIKEQNTTLEYLSHYAVEQFNLLILTSPEDEVSFPIYLYNFGYYTITRYDRETSMVHLGFPNFEIFSGLLNELPKEISELPANSPHLITLLDENDMKQFFKHLNYLTYITFENEYKGNINEYEATRWIMQTLKSSHLKCEGGKILYDSLGNFTSSEMASLSKKNEEMGDQKITLIPSESGDLEILIYFTDVSYIFEIKAGSDCVMAIFQALEYLFDNASQILQGVDFSKTVYFVGLNVKYRRNRGNYIDEWVSIPYSNGQVFMNEMKATNVTKVLHLFRTRSKIKEKFSKHSDKIVWGENTLW